MDVISLFSGAGGMDLGFINNEFNILWANDFFVDAVETYKRNIGDHIILGDITKIKSEDIPEKKGEVDVVIGGFPCQGFSIANKNRDEKDIRNFLYLEKKRIIEDKQPKFFVAENVKGILSLVQGKVIKMIVEDFEKLGYNVNFKLLHSADYGIPQQRERVIIIGNRIGLDNIFPDITHKDLYPGEGNHRKIKCVKCSKEDFINFQPYKTTREAIEFLSNVELFNNRQYNYKIVNNRKIYNHIASMKVEDKFLGRKYKVNQHDICDYLRYWRSKSNWSIKKLDDHFGYKSTAGHWFRKDNNFGSIPKSSDWWELKKLLNFDDTYDKFVTTFIEKPIKFEQSLRITNWDRPSDTITATSPEIHVSKKRRLSVRECAILQTFPDSYIFYGSLHSQYRQVGNAVPVDLTTKIARIIRMQLEQYKNLSK